MGQKGQTLTGHNSGTVMISKVVDISFCSYRQALHAGMDDVAICFGAGKPI